MENQPQNTENCTHITQEVTGSSPVSPTTETGTTLTYLLTVEQILGETFILDGY